MEVDKNVITDDVKWLQDESHISWAVYHSKKLSDITEYEANSAMLLILRDDSKSQDTIKHVLDILINAINKLNPNKTAIIGLDQPLSGILKKIQWQYPERYGREKLVLMLGNLDIEMVILSCLRDWLEDNGWTTALTNSRVTTSVMSHCVLNMMLQNPNMYTKSQQSHCILLGRAHSIITSNNQLTSKVLRSGVMKCKIILLNSDSGQ